MGTLEDITQKEDEGFGFKEIKEALKYTIPTGILLTAWYVGSTLLVDAEREIRFKNLVDKAQVLELSKPEIGYMQTFKAENIDSDTSLLKHYLQKIIELNPNFIHDLVVRKAPDLNKDGEVGTH